MPKEDCIARTKLHETLRSNTGKKYNHTKDWKQQGAIQYSVFLDF